MKVFISHPFANEDLASILKHILEENEIDAYMAQRVKEYQLVISEKIRTEINNSDYVIAIVTKDTRASASVNQELGYAQGKEVPIIIMIEKKAKTGVLTYGIEPEEFTHENFNVSCKNVKKYLLEKGVMRSEEKSTEFLSDEFIKTRNLKEDSQFFGSNPNSAKLEQSVLLPETYNKAFVLFSAIPKILHNDKIDVASSDFENWISKERFVKIKDQSFLFLDNTHNRIDIDSIVYYPYGTTPQKLAKYFEFQRNGFFEHGITCPLIFEGKYAEKNQAYLQLCWLTGVFWEFSIFCKKYYDHIQLKDNLDIILSIRNSNKLMLRGFGGKTENGSWSEPGSMWWRSDPPLCNRENIQLKITGLKKEQLTPEYIESKTHEFSTKIANAYGLKIPMCYNSDGSFNFELFSHYQ